MNYFDFNDIQLIPKKCSIYSRRECDTTIKFGKHTFKLPIIPANMVSVINADLAIKLAKNGYFYIMHRFNFDNFEFVQKCIKDNLISSISIGVKDYDYDLINRFVKNKITPDYITVDIAHGHSDRLQNIVKFLKAKLPNTFIIAGNIATTEAALDLEEWGVDALKIGVGPGKVCITKLKTGFGTAGWQLSAVEQISKVTKLPIILDGGLRFPGDIAKAIRFGAKMCMLGMMIVGYEESPGAVVIIKNVKYKEYYGSASIFNKKTKTNIEGKKELVLLKGSIFDYLLDLQQDLQSAISYSGGKTLQDIKKVNYIVVRNSILTD